MGGFVVRRGAERNVLEWDESAPPPFIVEHDGDGLVIPEERIDQTRRLAEKFRASRSRS